MQALTQPVLFVTRHGQTTYNQEERFQGTLPVPLNPAGEAQAHRLAAHLLTSPTPIQRIYTSDIVRAVQTAEIVAAQVATPVIIDPLLREISCGTWSGKLKSEVHLTEPAALRAWRTAPLHNRMAEGEHLLDVWHRLSAFYQSIQPIAQQENILIVSHGAVITVLLSYLLNWDIEEVWHSKRARHANTALSELALDRATNQYSLVRLGTTDHLRH